MKRGFLYYITFDSVKAEHRGIKEEMIRKFKRSDLGLILQIEEEAFPKAPYNRVTFLYYASICPSTFLVYEDKERNAHEIIGYIIFYPGGHIVSIAVHPAYRRRGIGTRLVEEVLKRTKGMAIVEVRESNEVAILFYKRLGFELQTIIPKYYGNEDALVMVRKKSLSFLYKWGDIRYSK